MKNSNYCFYGKIVFLLAILMSSTQAEARSCTYTTYKWNTEMRKAVEFKRVAKAYSHLTEKEVDPITGCSVCSEDQIAIQVGNLPSVKICRVLASSVEKILNSALASGQPIVELVGYRVGMTRGDVDTQGNRTKFSNHSFGTAFDINASFNGLYDNCVEFNSSCRLIKGGEWNPTFRESISADSFLVKQLLSIGLLWGGNIAGKQKDFMHFSLSGY